MSDAHLTPSRDELPTFPRMISSRKGLKMMSRKMAV